ADKVIAKKASDRFRARDSSWKEKLAALAVSGAMKAKVKLGMGLNENTNLMNKCLKNLEKLRKYLEESQKVAEDSLQILQKNQ
ncbi:unnamed protein product, partial [Callosobruchus maculatus]